MSRDSVTITRGAIIESLKKSSGKGVATQAYNEMVDNIDYTKLTDALTEMARNGHRSMGGKHYQNRTETLSKATYAKSFKNGSIAVGYDSSKTTKPWKGSGGYDYGEFIRFGNTVSSWGGDDFVQEAVDSLDGITGNLLQESIDDAVNVTNASFSILSITSALNFFKRWFR